MKNSDFTADKALTMDFLSNFVGPQGDPKYLCILQDVANRKIRAVQISRRPSSSP
jgi:DNA replication licensing factor MCM7